MRYYNAIEASRSLNISDKTIRRWVKKGKISAKRTQFNEIAIPESEIDRLRQGLGSSDQWVGSLHSLPGAVNQDRVDTSIAHGIEERMASLAQSIANLNATVSSQTRRIDELTARVAELEAKSVPMPPIPLPTPATTTSKPKPPVTSPTRFDDIPSDWTLCSDFFESHGIKETTWRRWIKDNLAGDHFECEEKPQSSGKTTRYFTPQQQEQALELLRKHGKLP